MTTDLVGINTGQVIDSVLEADPDEVFLINPSPAVIEMVIETLSRRGDDRPVRLLAAEGVLKDAMEDFILASHAADLVEEGSLSMRVTALPQTSLLVMPDRVVSLVATGDTLGGLATDDEAFLDTVSEAYEDAWADAEEFSLRTPSITRVRTTLEESIGPDALEDFDSMLASVETARGSGDDLDEVTISLLAAAKNEVLLYDISKWGEDVGIASKATFSRTKTELEELGLIDTDKVPQDVGRPRLRLKLADERLADADAEELTNVAQSVLAS
jgi:hypothetical protein